MERFLSEKIFQGCYYYLDNIANMTYLSLNIFSKKTNNAFLDVNISFYILQEADCFSVTGSLALTDETVYYGDGL